MTSIQIQALEPPSTHVESAPMQSNGPTKGLHATPVISGTTLHAWVWTTKFILLCLLTSHGPALNADSPTSPHNYLCRHQRLVRSPPPLLIWPMLPLPAQLSLPTALCLHPLIKILALLVILFVLPPQLPTTTTSEPILSKVPSAASLMPLIPYYSAHLL